MDGLALSGILMSGISWPIGLAATSAVPPTAADPGLLMGSLQAIFLGLVQGITEFLPISSTAHLLVVTKVLGWELLGKKWFVDAIQFGSVVAVVLYFWPIIRQVVVGGWHAFQTKQWEREEWKLLVGVAIGTLPALMGGLLIKKVGLSDVLNTPFVIGCAAIIMAILLGWAENVGTRHRKFNALQIRDGVLVGLGQMIALIPGASRSGSTLTAALFLGLERQTAAQFSFLLGLPTLTIATLFEAKDAVEHPEAIVPLFVGIASTFVFSYLSIAWLMKFLQRQSNWVFVWYRLAFGTALLVAVLGGVLK